MNIQSFAASLSVNSGPLPTWLDYTLSSPAEKRAIEVRWCRVGHGYQGTCPVDRAKALKLYIRAVAERKASGELPPSQRRQSPLSQEDQDFQFDNDRYSEEQDGRIRNT